MLAANHVRFSAQGKEILREASLAIHPGELLVVIGPNGAGKSTLFKLLAGEHRPVGGSVSLDGRELDDWSRLNLARRRGVMPQSSHLAFPFSAFDVAMMGRSPHLAGRESEQDKAIVMKAMASTGVEELIDRNYNTLSGGEQQRVQLARALSQVWIDSDNDANEPHYLLLDEPVASMDPANQLATLKVAREFSRRGAGVLLVLHDINLAAMFADRIAVMCAGKLRYCGAPSEVLSRNMIAEIFGMNVLVEQHPSMGCPLIIPMPEQQDMNTNRPLRASSSAIRKSAA